MSLTGQESITLVRHLFPIARIENYASDHMFLGTTPPRTATLSSVPIFTSTSFIDSAGKVTLALF